MSYHIVEIIKTSDTLKIMGFEERNPYLYPQNEQIVDFEITISGVKHYQTNEMYSFSEDANGKIQISFYKSPYKVERVQEINSFVREFIGSNYGDIEKVSSQKPLRHFVIQDQESVVNVLSDTELVIRMAKDLGVLDILCKKRGMGNK